MGKKPEEMCQREHRSDPFEEERNHREGGKEEREKGQVILIYLYHVCSNATSPFR